jgi:uncharacterized protein
MAVRTLWLMIGLLSVAAAIAGVILPLVPTTPFLLLAAFAFARSSPKLHDWLINHRRFGPPIMRWRTSGAISVRSKAAGTVAMVAALALSVIAGFPNTIIIAQAIVMFAVLAFLLTRPS